MIASTALTLAACTGGGPDTSATPSAITSAGPAPAPGTAYVLGNAQGTVSVIAPGATSVETTIALNRPLDTMLIAPAGAPNAGTVYVAKGSETFPGPGPDVISVIPPGITDSYDVTVGTSSPVEVTMAPAGIPNAGTVYVVNKDGTLATIAPGATRATVTDLGSPLDQVVIAPAGTPEAGTLYLTRGQVAQDKTISVVPPGATTVQATIQLADWPQQLTIAPAGTPNAGTLFVTNDFDAALYVIPPGATSPSATFHFTGNAGKAIIAPADTPKAGTAYVIDRVYLNVIPPGASKLKTRIWIGNNPSNPTIAPAGTPNEGSVFVTEFDSRYVDVISPGADSVTHRVEVRSQPGSSVVAPAGTPNAGTLYLTAPAPSLMRPATQTGTISVIAPGASKSDTVTVVSAPTVPVVAPAGTPNAGTLYVPQYDTGAIVVVQPDASGHTQIPVGSKPTDIVFAP